MTYGVVNGNILNLGLPEVMSSDTVPTEQPAEAEDNLYHGKLDSS